MLGRRPSRVAEGSARVRVLKEATRASPSKPHPLGFMGSSPRMVCLWEAESERLPLLMQVAQSPPRRNLDRHAAFRSRLPRIHRCPVHNTDQGEPVVRPYGLRAGQGTGVGPTWPILRRL